MSCFGLRPTFARIAFDPILGPCPSIGDSLLLQHTNPFVARLLNIRTARQIRLLQKMAYGQVEWWTGQPIET